MRDARVEGQGQQPEQRVDLPAGLGKAGTEDASQYIHSTQFEGVLYKRRCHREVWK